MFTITSSERNSGVYINRRGTVYTKGQRVRFCVGGIIMQKGGFMKRFVGMSLALLLGLGLVNTAAGAERVVMVEEMYQEG